MTKRAFILSQSPDLSAEDIVKRGKAKGFKITPGYVYVTRSKAKAKKTGGGKAGKADKAKADVRSLARHLTTLEKTLRKLQSELKKVSR